MIPEGEIIRALNMLINGKITAAFTAEVAKNDEAESKGIVDVFYNGLTYHPKLKSVLDGKDKHFLAIPKVGSRIFCVSEGNSQERFIALAFNEVEKIVYRGQNISLIADDVNELFGVAIGNLSLSISDSEIKFNGAAKNSYLTDINKLVDKINAVEQSLNTLKQAVSGWMPAPNDGGAALKAAAGSWAGEAITPTTINDLKDEKIRH